MRTVYVIDAAHPGLLWAVQYQAGRPTGREWRWDRTSGRWIELPAPRTIHWKLLLEPGCEQVPAPADVPPPTDG